MRFVHGRKKVFFVFLALTRTPIFVSPFAKGEIQWGCKGAKGAKGESIKALGAL